ncbi:Cof-type HAD-IIB family hydrolase [Loigolactobacillus iwatensis]|uniref:Cof-type HAD-IIB family hydrolase n=1 Tax=Loigolactobacillus iwatensis TaxID=1267156 RepID=UPI000F7EFDD7|nr:Cof-type HAD-IIB family hydrolase [Loigolactobacillus iwatensis]
MTIQHIFSDLDGTLLNSAGQVSAVNQKAISACKLPLTLVSARAPQEMASIITKLNLSTPQIAFNGGLVFKPSASKLEVLSQSTIDFNLAGRLLTVLKLYFPQVSLSFYDLHNWYTERIDKGIRYAQNLNHQPVTQLKTTTFFSQHHHDVFKIMLLTFDLNKMAALIDFLAKLNIAGVSIQQSGDYCLEITSEQAKKSRGINYILQAEHLAAREATAFGDGYNDLSMLEMVGYPIVMGNAFDDLKTKDVFVTKTNDENGVSYALDHLIRHNLVNV